MRSPSLPTLLALLAPLVCAACASAPPARLDSSRTPPGPRLLVEGVDGLALFRDERGETEELLAAWAGRQGLALVPLDRAHAVFERARLGQRVDTGESCGQPLARWQATRRYGASLGATGRLHARVDCDAKSGACTLDVSSDDALDFDGHQTGHWTAPYDAAAPWRDALPRAIGALAPPADKEFEGGLGGLVGGVLGGNVEAHGEKVGLHAYSALASDHRPHASFDDAIPFANGAAGTAALRACFNEDGGGGDHLVAFDAQGRVTRCEPREFDSPVAGCICSVLAAHAAGGPAVRDTRVFVGTSLTAASVVTPWSAIVVASTHTYLDVYKNRDGQSRWRPLVSHPSISEWRQPSDRALARCFADVPERRLFKALVAVDFDFHGRPTSVTVRSHRHHPLTAEQIACVQRVFHASSAPCPDAWSSTAKAELSVTVRAIGEPMNRPFP